MTFQITLMPCISLLQSSDDVTLMVMIKFIYLAFMSEHILKVTIIIEQGS